MSQDNLMAKTRRIYETMRRVFFRERTRAWLFAKMLWFSDPILAEVFMATFAMIYGVVWMLPFDTFSLDIYSVLKEIISEESLGVLMVILSFATVYAIYFSKRRLRAVVSVAYTFAWMTIGLSILRSTLAAPSGYIFMAQAAFSAWVIARAGK